MENNLAKYIAFIKTAETGSFTRAAENLNYAQSTVSKIIADLEKEGGVTLLERSRSGVRLTSCGERVLPLARAVLNDQRELNGYIDQINGIKAGVVKIGTFASVAVNWLPNIFARLCKDYPEVVRVQIDDGSFGKDTFDNHLNLCRNDKINDCCCISGT